jgi:hypothetical protein
MNPNNKQGAFLGPSSAKSCTVKSVNGITKTSNRGWEHGNSPTTGATEQTRNDKNGYPTK